jgi:hypothetical protein
MKSDEDEEGTKRKNPLNRVVRSFINPTKEEASTVQAPARKLVIRLSPTLADFRFVADKLGEIGPL